MLTHKWCMFYKQVSVQTITLEKMYGGATEKAKFIYNKSSYDKQYGNTIAEEPCGVQQRDCWGIWMLTMKKR